MLDVHALATRIRIDLEDSEGDVSEEKMLALLEKHGIDDYGEFCEYIESMVKGSAPPGPMPVLTERDMWNIVANTFILGLEYREAYHMESEILYGESPDNT